MVRISRRSFVKGVGAGTAGAWLGLGGHQSGCGGGSGGPPAKQARRILHFNLSHAPAQAAHALHLGFDLHALTPHTADTRSAHRGTNPFLRYVPDVELTHFVDVELPKNAMQALFVSHAIPNRMGVRHMTLAGIHLPSWAVAAQMQRTVRAGKGLHHRRIARLGVPERDVMAGLLHARDGQAPRTRDANLADYTDFSQAAQLIIFCHPDLMGLDPETSCAIMGIIEDTPSFADLVSSLGSQGQAADLADVADYSGWANAEEVTDSAGNVAKAENGDPQWRWTYTDETKVAAQPVMQQALRMVRDDPRFEGKRYVTTYGANRATNFSTSSKSSCKKTPRAADPYLFTTDRSDWAELNYVEIESVSGRAVTLRVHNASFRHVGVFLRYLDANDMPLALASLGLGGAQLDTTHLQYLDYVDAPARFLGVPIPELDCGGISPIDSCKSFTVTLPDAASSVEVLVASLGASGLHEATTTYENCHGLGCVLTGCFDLGIPMMMLAWGAGTSNLTGWKAIMADLAKDLVTVFADGVFGAILSDKGAGDDMLKGWGKDIIKDMMIDAPTIFYKMIKAALAEQAAQKAVTAVPWLGLLWEALNICGTEAELVETVVSIAMTPFVSKTTVRASMDIKITINKDLENAAGFPEVATKYKVIVSFSGSKPQVIERDLANPHQSSLQEQLFFVPSGGKVNVSVSFLAGNDWVAAHGSSGDVVNLVPAGQSALGITVDVKENTIPLSDTTVYTHREKLIVSGGALAWQEGPASTAADFDCLGTTDHLCDLIGITLGGGARLGYGWQGSTRLAACSVDGGVESAGQIYAVQNIGLDTANPGDALRILGCGFNVPAHLAYAYKSTGTNGPRIDVGYLVAARQDSADPTKPAVHYHATRVDLTITTAIDPTQGPSYGRFAAPRLGAVAVHHRGILVGMNSENDQLELLDLRKGPYDQPSDAHYALKIGCSGSAVGLLKGVRSIALSRDGDAILVLEEANNRLQAFDAQGNSVNYFSYGATSPNGAPTVALQQHPDDTGQQIRYLDLAMEEQGYIYVLSRKQGGTLVPGSYRLDIYQASGQLLARTQGIAAARIVVDRWRSVFSLNYETLVSPKTGAEPSVSAWVPMPPPG